MKERAVSALRIERGLRTEARNAEPQVVGLAPQTTVMTERANTMKAYILRDSKAVEPQNPTRRDPGLNPRMNATCGPSAPPLPVSSGSVLYVGLDVHNETIAASLAPDQSSEVRRYGIIGGSHDDVLRLIKKLCAAHPGLALQFCYEAGPRGYPLCRFIRSHGAQCIVVAPSKVPRQ